MAREGVEHRWRKPMVVGAAMLVAPLAMAASACRAPTEMTLHVSTDVKCSDFNGAAITVGVTSDVETKAPATVTSTCSADGTIGSLVVVPSGSETADVVVRIAGGVDRDPTTCTDGADAGGCIVARRALGFIEHTPLDLDIPLRSDCNGVVCSPNQTCANGGCISDIVPSGCGASGACTEGDLVAANDGGATMAMQPDATLLDGSDVMEAAVPFDAGDATVANDSGPALDAGKDAATDAASSGDAGPEAAGPCNDGSDPNAYWGSTGHCATHDEHSPNVANTGGNIAINQFLSNTIALNPLAIDGSGDIYAGGSDGNLYILDSGGAKRSEAQIDDVTSTAVLSANDLYAVGARVTRIARSNLATTASTASVVAGIAPILTADNVLVVGGKSGTLGLSTTSATTLPTSWTNAQENATVSTAYSAGPGTATLLSDYGAAPLLTLNTASGAAISSTAANYNGNLMVAFNRTYVWSSKLLSIVGTTTILQGGIYGMAVTSTALVALIPSASGNGGSSFALLDPVTLSTMATHSLGSVTFVSQPVVDVNDTVYFETSDGQLHMFDSGGTDSTIGVGSGSTQTVTLAIGNGELVVGSFGGVAIIH